MAEGKRMRKLREKAPAALLSLADAVKFVKGAATAKFDETIEVAINLNVDPRKAEQSLRGMVQLPNGTGKKMRVLVFAKGPKAEEATKAGADLVGADDIAERIMGGELNFDRCIATPDMMGVVGKLGKVLGPKGLMPNPKLGTVTMDVGAAVAAAKGGQIEYRVEKTGIIHAGVGKASFTPEALEGNIKALMDVLVKARPAGIKGTYVKKLTMSSTMGPGVVVDAAALVTELSGAK